MRRLCITECARIRSFEANGPGPTHAESIGLAKAEKRIRQLEDEVETLKIAVKIGGEDRSGTKGPPVVDALMKVGNRGQGLLSAPRGRLPGHVTHKDRAVQRELTLPVSTLGSRCRGQRCDQRVGCGIPIARKVARPKKWTTVGRA